MKTLICMGDSLTEGTDIPVGHTWPTLVATALNIEVINCGIGGDTTAGMLARFYPDVVAAKSAFAFIMGGTNDLWWGLEVNTILGNLFSMIVQARHHGITPVIGLPLPVHTVAARQNDYSPPWKGYDRFNEEMDLLMEKIAIHSAESEAALIDLHRPFIFDDGKVRTDLFLPDGLHPNRAGHLAVAKAIGQGFQRNFQFKA